MNTYKVEFDAKTSRHGVVVRARSQDEALDEALAVARVSNVDEATITPVEEAVDKIIVDRPLYNKHGERVAGLR
jgi:hypothetical protein